MPAYGLVLALASAVLFGASTPLAKMLLGSVDPWLMAGLLYLGAGVGLLLIRLGMRLLHRPSGEAALGRADLPWLALVALCGGVAGPLLLMLGLARTSAANASLLLNLEGLATLLIAWIVLREAVDRRLVVGALAILSGAAVLSWQGSARIDAGAVLIAGACLCWGIDNTLTRRLSSADPLQIVTVKGLTAGLVNTGLALACGSHLPHPGIAAAVGLVGFLGYGVSLLLFVLGLRHLGAARTGACFSTAPFVGAVLSVPALGETISVTMLAAGALMAIGVWLHLSERHEHDHVHEEMEHEHRHRHDIHHQHGHDHGANLDPRRSHSHRHRHPAMTHRHPHYPDPHHRHGHRS